VAAGCHASTSSRAPKQLDPQLDVIWPPPPPAAPRYIFDGTASRDPSGRALTNATWELIDGTDASLTATIAALNQRTVVRSRLNLALNGTQVFNMADGAYTLRLEVTNFFNLTTLATFTFSKVSPGSVSGQSTALAYTRAAANRQPPPRA
jgi:hypothetical protein